MPNFRYVICPALSSVPIGELELSSVAWNDPVAGTGGSFSGQAEINVGQNRDRLLALTEPWAVALYVYDPATGQYLFGGPVSARPWNHDTRRLEIQAISWKSWTYQKLFNMLMTTNPVSDLVYSIAAADQFKIARDFFAIINADVGVPVFGLGTELSGVNRDLAIQGSQFKFIGDIVDSMANRDNGFEWNVTAEPDSSGNPKLWFRPYWPIRGQVNSTVILFNEQPHGGNILAFENPDESADETRTRCWATGAGQPPDMLAAYDQDPALDYAPDGFVLMSERVDNYATVTDILVLAQHARTARQYYGQRLSSVVLKMALDDPNYALYSSGDKVRMRVLDDWWDWDFNAVRIIDRSISVNNESDVDHVKVLLDLNDTELPQDVTQV